MNTWETYRDLPAPAGVLTADPDWLALQYTPPFTPPLLDKVLDFPRGIPGASVIVARNVRLCAYALSASGAVLAPGTGTLTLQVLEVVTGSTGPVLVEIAALVLDLCQDEDSGLGAFGNGDYILRAVSAANVPAGTTSYRIAKKAIG